MNIYIALRRVVFLSPVISLMGIAPLAHAQSPVYLHSYSDDIWLPVRGGAYRVAVTTENYPNEIWERSVEDDQLPFFCPAGGTLLSLRDKL